MKTTLEQIKNWNGKIYNNAVYFDGKKIEDAETVNELKLYGKVLSEYYTEWEVLKREESKTELLSFLFHNKEELICLAIENGFVCSNENAGKNLVISFYFDNEFNRERWSVNGIIEDFKIVY